MFPFIISSIIFQVLIQNEKKGNDVIHVPSLLQNKEAFFLIFLIIIIYFSVSGQLKSPFVTLQSHDCHCTNTCRW